MGAVLTNRTTAAPFTSDHVLHLAAVQLAYLSNIRKNQGNYWLPDEPLLALPYASVAQPLDSPTALADLDLGDEFESRTEDALRGCLDL